MTDETPKKRRRRPPDADVQPPPFDAAAAGDEQDPDAALERLASMASGAPAGPVPPAPAVSSFSSPPSGRQVRPKGSAQRTSRSRPRPAGGPGSTRMVARIAAPVIFLVAVIVVVGIVVQSGVMGGSGEPSPTPTAKSTKAVSVTKKYVVQSGDSLSSIAERFGTTVDELVALNPDLSSSTLRVGVRIVVPRN